MKDDPYERFMDDFEEEFGVRPKASAPRFYEVKGHNYRLWHLISFWEQKNNKVWKEYDHARTNPDN
tara:strand:- start:26010 stop:26207 length:198 start_codon:yes stop_codon:yes gene_type:complete